MRYKIILRSVIVVLVTLYILQGCSLFGNGHHRYLSQTMNNTSLEIRYSGNTIGTASIVRLPVDDCHYKYVILTAGHVISKKDPRKTVLHAKNSRSYSVDDFYQPVGLDVALIESREISGDIRAGGIQNALALGDSSLEGEDLGRNVVLFYFGNRGRGHYLSTIIPSKGYIINADEKQLWLHAPLVGSGGSGASVVLNDTRKVIGIVSQIETHKAYGFETGAIQAVPSNLVLEILRGYESRTGLISKRFYPYESSSAFFDSESCLDMKGIM